MRSPSVIAICVALPVLLVALAKAPPQLAAVTALVFALGCSVLAIQAFLYAMAPMTYPTSIRGIGVGAAAAFARCCSSGARRIKSRLVATNRVKRVG